MQNQNSKPTLCEFDPTVIPYQLKVIQAFQSYDYSLGTHEVMLSGSVGSAKSVLMAHIAIVHCLKHSKARVLIGRKAMPDLKSTIFLKVLEHLEDLKEGEDYKINYTSSRIKFRNGSQIISRSWADKQYKKMRSLELSGAIIEELTENKDDEFYKELKMRVNRIPHINEPFILCATNPDSPGHWAYKYFIASESKTRHVYYSCTEDNPFLPPSYVDQLKEDLDPKLARRMIYGEWLEITTEVVYYAYDKSKNFVPKSYNINPNMPIHITYDFNIGEGKPLSAALFQFVNGIMHIFNEVVVEGMRTNDSLDELALRGFLDYNTKYIIHGDASGRNRDTRSIKSDYDLIKLFLSNYRNKEGRLLTFELQVPKSNPPIRKRHNLVNAYCCNEKNTRRLFVYKDAPIADEGLRLTALKQGGNYIEDDSKSYQHITTAIGYGLARCHIEIGRKQRTIQL